MIFLSMGVQNRTGEIPDPVDHAIDILRRDLGIQKGVPVFSLPHSPEEFDDIIYSAQQSLSDFPAKYSDDQISEFRRLLTEYSNKRKNSLSTGKGNRASLRSSIPKKDTSSNQAGWNSKSPDPSLEETPTSESQYHERSSNPTTDSANGDPEIYEEYSPVTPPRYGQRAYARARVVGSDGAEAHAEAYLETRGNAIVSQLNERFHRIGFFEHHSPDIPFTPELSSRLQNLMGKVLSNTLQPEDMTEIRALGREIGQRMTESPEGKVMAIRMLHEIKGVIEGEIRRIDTTTGRVSNIQNASMEPLWTEIVQRIYPPEILGDVTQYEALKKSANPTQQASTLLGRIRLPTGYPKLTIPPDITQMSSADIADMKRQVYQAKNLKPAEQAFIIDTIDTGPTTPAPAVTPAQNALIQSIAQNPQALAQLAQNQQNTGQTVGSQKPQTVNGGNTQPIRSLPKSTDEVVKDILNNPLKALPHFFNNVGSGGTLFLLVWMVSEMIGHDNRWINYPLRIGAGLMFSRGIGLTEWLTNSSEGLETDNALTRLVNSIGEGLGWAWGKRSWVISAFKGIANYSKEAVERMGLWYDLSAHTLKDKNQGNNELPIIDTKMITLNEFTKSNNAGRALSLKKNNDPSQVTPQDVDIIKKEVLQMKGEAYQKIQKEFPNDAPNSIQNKLDDLMQHMVLKEFIAWTYSQVSYSDWKSSSKITPSASSSQAPVAVPAVTTAPPAPQAGPAPAPASGPPASAVQPPPTPPVIQQVPITNPAQAIP